MIRQAGEFGQWLAAMRAVLRGDAEADVPCDGCTGCCISSYPIPLRPTDRVALQKVPDRYLRLPPVPGMGLARMGFRDDGCCPMLEANTCSIYADRPQTCRDYDCRIYAATGLEPDGERPVIQQRVREWRFSINSEREQVAAEAMRRTAQYIRRNAALFPAEVRAESATAAAVLAVKVHPLFMRGREDCAGAPDDGADVDLVARIMEAARLFDARTTAQQQPETQKGP